MDTNLDGKRDNDKYDELAAVVNQAQTGDTHAFGRLVERFQDMAYATALSSLGERQAAEDAAQDAFLDAFRHLPDLREPLAFPAWFKRIVWKHCERRYRGKRPALLPLDDHEEAGKLAADLLSPDAMLEQWQYQQAVRAAVEALPLIYRQAVTLFYLQGLSYQETADRLNVPLSTIKKRLHAARHLLKERMTTMITLDYRPSQDDTFAHRVKFALALKANDLLQVRQLARRSPELLETKAEWGVGSDGWYWPLGTTPLHWAAGTGDRPLAELLLELGANPNTPDVNGNTPLKRAVHMGQEALGRWLLEHGADPNLPANNGQTPLHVAVSRFAKSRHNLVETLLAHDADPTLRDNHGRTAADWAAVKGDLDLAQQLGAEATAAATAAPTPPTLSQPAPGSMWETGIKIIDLLAPLTWGGRNGIFTPLAGIGIDVLLAELIQRLASFYGGTAVQIAVEHGDFTEASRRLQWRNCGIEQHVETFFAREGDSAAKRQHVVANGVERARTLAAEKPVLFLVYTDLALSEGVIERLNDLAQTENVTLLFAGIESIGAEPPPLQQLDAALTFDRYRANQGLWPAVDPLRSYTTTYRDERHHKTATAARRLFARYQDLHHIYDLRGMSGFEMALFGEAEPQAVLRARRLHRYLSQPLFVAEAWSGVPGEFTPLPETLQTVQAILDGAFDETAEDELTTIGSWSPKWT